MTGSPLSVRPARVSELDESGCWVEFEDQRCAGCTGSCGFRGVAPGPVRVVGDPMVGVGSLVNVGIVRRTLTATMVRLFGLPVVALIAAPLIIRALDPNVSEVGLAITGMVALAVAMWCGVRLAVGPGRALDVRLLTVCPSREAGR